MSQQEFYETVQREQEWNESRALLPCKSPVLSSGKGFGCEPLIAPDKEPIMAKISEMLPSNYLKQSDFPEDYVVTVRSIERKNIAMDGKPAEYKWLAHYEEFEKPMVLNSTNIQLMAKACGSDDTDDWIGKQIIVYVDENVSFGGELVGGLRIRKHKQAAPITPTRKPAAVRSVAAGPGMDDDDIPL